MSLSPDCYLPFRDIVFEALEWKLDKIGQQNKILRRYNSLDYILDLVQKGALIKRQKHTEVLVEVIKEYREELELTKKDALADQDKLQEVIDKIDSFFSELF